MENSIQESIPPSNNKLTYIILRKFFNFVGYSGVLFIIYGVISTGTGSVWQLLERWVTPVSAFLTLTATILVSASVYFHAQDIHPPERFSKFVSAPSVITCCLIALCFLFINRSLPPVIVNGFALLGISGGFFRIQRKPSTY